MRWERLDRTVSLSWDFTRIVTSRDDVNAQTSGRGDTQYPPLSFHPASAWDSSYRKP